MQGESDDQYIIQYAKENNGFILSKDLFEDHINYFNHNTSGMIKIKPY